MKDPSSKLTRMRLDLEEYDFEIDYIKGSDNAVADALSRIPTDEIDKNKKVNAITRSMTRNNNNNVSNSDNKVTNKSSKKMLFLN
jgi:hypothetical protein